MNVSRRTVNLPVEEFMKLLVCPLLSLERTLTVFTHHQKTLKDLTQDFFVVVSFTF